MTPINLNQQQEFLILQICSGHYLWEEIPDNWEKLEEEEQDQFLRDHAWQPLEHAEPNYIYEKIELAYDKTIALFKKLNNT